MSTPPPLSVLTGNELLRVTAIGPAGTPAGLDTQTTTQAIANLSPTGNTGLSGMTAGQVPLAATATTVTSSRATGTTGNSTILQTDSGGHIAAAVIPNTAVTPASYTLASLTVGADGRLTAASNGTIPTVASLTLSEIAAPTAPVSGAIIYVDSTTHLLSAVDSQGNRGTLLP